MVAIATATVKIPMLNIDVQWIVASEEPTAPTGYARCPDFDINLGQLGNAYAFKATA